MECKEEDAFYFVSSEGIGTAITNTQIVVCFLDKAHVNQTEEK